MAETDFSRLDHRVPVARAEVRIVTPTGLDDVARVERMDLHSYPPLQNPDAPSHPGHSPPTPAAKPPQTEAQLREVLEQCVLSSKFAADSVDRAHATHERAVRHVERCRERLAEYAGLDDEITEATVAALRSGNGRPRVDANDALRRRAAERDIARSDLADSERALRVLFDALADAQADAAAATKAANIAAAEIIALTAQAMAARILDLEAEAQRQRELLYGFDKVATAAGLRTSRTVLRVYGDTNRFLRPVEGAPWIAARDALLVDPMAEVNVG